MGLGCLMDILPASVPTHVYIPRSCVILSQRDGGVSIFGKTPKTEGARCGVLLCRLTPHYNIQSPMSGVCLTNGVGQARLLALCAFWYRLVARFIDTTRAPTFSAAGHLLSRPQEQFWARRHLKPTPGHPSPRHAAQVLRAQLSRARLVPARASGFGENLS